MDKVLAYKAEGYEFESQVQKAASTGALNTQVLFGICLNVLNTQPAIIFNYFQSVYSL